MVLGLDSIGFNVKMDFVSQRGILAVHRDETVAGFLGCAVGRGDYVPAAAAAGFCAAVTRSQLIFLGLEIDQVYREGLEV